MDQLLDKEQKAVLKEGSEEDSAESDEENTKETHKRMLHKSMLLRAIMARFNVSELYYPMGKASPFHRTPQGFFKVTSLEILQEFYEKRYDERLGSDLAVNMLLSVELKGYETALEGHPQEAAEMTVKEVAKIFSCAEEKPSQFEQDMQVASQASQVSALREQCLRAILETENQDLERQRKPTLNLRKKTDHLYIEQKYTSLLKANGGMQETLENLTLLISMLSPSKQATQVNRLQSIDQSVGSALGPMVEGPPGGPPVLRYWNKMQNQHTQNATQQSKTTKQKRPKKSSKQTPRG